MRSASVRHTKQTNGKGIVCYNNPTSNEAYIIGHYNPSVRITAQLYALISYVNGGTYCLISTPNDRFFEKLFHGRFTHSLTFCQKSAERKGSKKGRKKKKIFHV